MAISEAFRRRKEMSSPDNSSPSGTVDADAHRDRSAVIRHRIAYVIIYLVAFIFIILVIIGNTSDRAVIKNTYFIKIDVSNVIPQSVPDAVLINSIARTIGLHDFYQVGLWNFCEGYMDGTGITYCSKPQKLYYFNPVEILMNELLSGATIALPSEVVQILAIVQTASNWMFGLFVTSAILIFLCIFFTPFSVPSSLSPHKSKHRAVSKRYFIPLTLFTFLTFFATVAASLVATAMFTIFKIVFSSKAIEFNIGAELGVRMLVFMWIAVAFVLLGFFLHVRSILAWCCCCCCRPRQSRIHKEEEMGARSTGQDGGNGMREVEHDGAGNGEGEKHKLFRFRRVRMDG
ncbi:hypothetical protein FQN55_001815 [Onygenales sp. PD_40]|nr:hypothetical protein FQN55_001815 [Onygenales sp. PD_40]